jgi:actin-related protein
MKQIEKSSIIIDIGTGFIKSGFGGEENPISIIPTIIGKKKNKGIIMGNKNNKEYYIGNDAISNYGILENKFPIEHNIIIDWDSFEKIFEFIINNELKIKPEEFNFILSEAILNPIKNGEKLVEIMFEKFNVKNLFISNQPRLTLLSKGKFNGIVLDSGEGVSQIGCFNKGFILNNTLKRTDIGGRDINNYLKNLLLDKDININRFIINEIKENLCYCSKEFNNEINNFKNIDYELPDGNKIKLGNELIKCIEILFNPELYQVSYRENFGLIDLFKNSVEKIYKNYENNKEIFDNIYFTGGNCFIKGIGERFINEIKNINDDNKINKFNVTICNDNKYTTWIGGSVLSSLSIFNNNLVSKLKYNEIGVSQCYKLCSKEPTF